MDDHDWLTSLDADQHAFYDIQTLRRGHIARARTRPIPVSGTLLCPDGDVRFSARVFVHLTLHTCGFMVVRPTLHSEDFRSGSRVDVETMIQLERAFWRFDYPLRWHFPNTEQPTVGGVRTVMNWVFLELFARLTNSGENVASLAAENIQGCDRLHEMAVSGEMRYPFPVSCVTQFEVLGGELTPVDTEQTAKGLAKRLLYPDDPHSEVSPIDLNTSKTGDWWFLSENQALTVAGGGAVDPELNAIDADRTQLLEFLTLRRATLRCVQRDTQRVLTERLAVSRGQIGHWQHVVASTTDDYILHDRIGRLLQPVRRHNAIEPRIRDLAELEEQVRRNLSWFQQRMDTLSQWTGGLVGAAVGTGAMVLSLQEAVKSVMVTATGTPSERLLDQHGSSFAAIMFVLMCTAFVLALFCIRRVTARLRPFSHRGKPPAAPRTRSTPPAEQPEPAL